MPFYAIAAMSENRVIGAQARIPWHQPADFRWFKYKTMGGTLVMGRKTFESIGKPLPGRKTFLLSRQADLHFAVPTHTFTTLFEYAANHTENYWVAGGGEIYSQLLDHCHYLYLTIVKRQVEGDVYFPSAAHVEKNHAFEQLIYDSPEFRVERWKYQNTKIFFPPEWMLPLEPWPFPVA